MHVFLLVDPGVVAIVTQLVGAIEDELEEVRDAVKEQLAHEAEQDDRAVRHVHRVQVGEELEGAAVRVGHERVVAIIEVAVLTQLLRIHLGQLGVVEPEWGREPGSLYFSGSFSK